MGGTGLSDEERAAKVARAWILHGRRWSLRAIAADIDVAFSTVPAYLREARAAAEWSEVVERVGRRARMGQFLNELAVIGVDRLQAVDEDGNPVERYKDVVPSLMTVVQEINRVEGNYAPIKVTTDDGKPPDPALIAAMREEARRAELADAEETRRELER